MQTERRKYKRFSVNIAARVEEEDEQAIAKDISAGGIAIRTVIDFEKESRVEFCFLIEGNDVRCEGQIKVKLQRDGGNVYGIEFAKDKMEMTKKLVDNLELIKSLEMNSKK